MGASSSSPAQAPPKPAQPANGGCPVSHQQSALALHDAAMPAAPHAAGGAAANPAAGAGGCPVPHAAPPTPHTAQAGGAGSEDKPRGCPVQHRKSAEAFQELAQQGGVGKPSPPAAGGGGGTVDVTGRQLNPLNMMPEERQRPRPDQDLPLSKYRMRSSIPKAEFTPEHQPADGGHWVYPSQQMFYNAMRRKGWSAREEDMPAVVAIHNAVNERTWQELLKWEAARKWCVVCVWCMCM